MNNNDEKLNCLILVKTFLINIFYSLLMSKLIIQIFNRMQNQYFFSETFESIESILADDRHPVIDERYENISP